MKWECKHGCNQKEYVEKTGGYCPHLEALLGPKGGRHRGSDVSFLSADLPSAPTPEDEYLRREAAQWGEDDEPDLLMDDEEILRRKLRKMGLPKKKAEVVVQRTVNGRTFKEIAQELGYSGANSAHRAYQDAIATMRRKYGGERA